MTIRRRTARRLATTGLSTAGLVHLAWAAGTSWPAPTRDELADLVVGVRPFPATPLTLAVVGAIGAGIWLIETESRAEPLGASPAQLRRLRRLAARSVPAILALRGAGGLIASSFELGTATTIFRRWDLLLYSPLCLALAALATMALRDDAYPSSPSAPTPPRPAVFLAGAVDGG